ncbi:unnamed protein product [Lampetra planeri]
MALPPTVAEVIVHDEILPALSGLHRRGSSLAPSGQTEIPPAGRRGSAQQRRLSSKQRAVHRRGLSRERHRQRRCIALLVQFR